MTPAEFFLQASLQSDSFAQVQSEHLRANDELLPHILMADLLRFVGMGVGGEQSLGVSPPSLAEVRQLLALVELGFSLGDSHLENALCVSFVENIDCEPFFPSLLPLLGPHVLAERARQQQWWDAR